MAAGIVEPDGKTAGRVTITTTLTSLIPPFATVLVVVVIFLLGIIGAEVAAALILGILVNAGLTTGTVYQTAKKTPTDQTRTVWATGPVTDVVTPPAPPAEPVVDVAAGTGAHRADTTPEQALWAEDEDDTPHLATGSTTARGEVS